MSLCSSVHTYICKSVLPFPSTHPSNMPSIYFYHLTFDIALLSSYWVMCLPKVTSLEDQHLPLLLYSFTHIVSAEEWGTASWPPFILTLSNSNNSTWAIYYFVQMSPWVQSPCLAIRNREMRWVCGWKWLGGSKKEREWERNGEVGGKSLRKIRNESIFSQAASFWVASRLTSFSGFTSQGVNTSHCAALLQSNDVRRPLRCRAGVNTCKRCHIYVF